MQWRAACIAFALGAAAAAPQRPAVLRHQHEGARRLRGGAIDGWRMPLGPPPAHVGAALARLAELSVSFFTGQPSLGDQGRDGGELGLRGGASDEDDSKPGLLSDASDLYYSRNLSLECLHNFTAFGSMWEALCADAAEEGVSPEACLQSIVEASEAFIKSREVFNRKGMTKTLDAFLRGDGGLGILLGGKSVGKSLLLTNAVSSLNNATGYTVAYVNMRAHGANLATGIVTDAIQRPWFDTFINMLAQALQLRPALVRSLTDQPKPWWRPTLPMGMRVGRRRRTWAEQPTQSEGDAILKATGFCWRVLRELAGIEPKPSLTDAVVAAFVDAAMQHGRKPILIIDEANLAFPTPTDLSAYMANKHTLAQLVMYTKELGRLTVLMASSEYTFPQGLEEGLEFGLNNVNRVIHAGGVPPDEMRMLLRVKWGVGPRLAEQLVGAYGGHIHQTSIALKHLRTRKQHFAPDMGVQEGLYDGVAACLKAEGVEETRGIKEMMRKLAQFGYVAIEDEVDPCVKLLVKHNLAGLVSRNHYYPGLPPEAWAGGTKFVLVATLQMIRPLIMSEL